MGKEKKNPIHVIEGLRIRKTGTFNYKEVHAAIFDWFMKLGYQFAETKHVEKDKPTGRIIESDWTGVRKVTSYVKYKVTVAILLKDYKEVSVEEDGRKIREGIGRLEITFNADMEKNYKKMFSERKGEFSNVVKSLYEKHVVNKKLDSFEDKLRDEVTSLYEQIKE